MRGERPAIVQAPTTATGWQISIAYARRPQRDLPIPPAPPKHPTDGRKGHTAHKRARRVADQWHFASLVYAVMLQEPGLAPQYWRVDEALPVCSIHLHHSTMGMIAEVVGVAL